MDRAQRIFTPGSLDLPTHPPLPLQRLHHGSSFLPSRGHGIGSVIATEE